MEICLRCTVSGEVQGVFFRATTRRRAQQLGVAGWVRNRADGSVEVLACGDEAKVRSLVEWLWQGPPQANVRGVVSESVGWEPFGSFEIG